MYSTCILYTYRESPSKDQRKVSVFTQYAETKTQWRKKEQKTSVKGKAIANRLTDSASFADFLPSFLKQFLRREYLKTFNMYCLCESPYENVGQYVIASAESDE